MVETTAVASTSHDGPDQLFRRLRSTAKGYHQHIEALHLAQSVVTDKKYAYIPRKELYVLEWLLDRMLKTREEAEPPILIPQAWAILRQILQMCEGMPRQADLPQLVSRIPFLSLFASLLNRLPEVSPVGTANASGAAARKGKRKATSATLDEAELDAMLDNACAVLEHCHQLSSTSGSGQVDGALTCFAAWLNRATDAVSTHSAGQSSSTQPFIKLGTALTDHYDALARSDKNAAKKAHTFALGGTLWPQFIHALSHLNSSIVDVASKMLQACLFTPANFARNLPSIPSTSALLSFEACRTSAVITALNQALPQVSQSASAGAARALALVTSLLYTAAQTYFSRLGQRHAASNADTTEFDRSSSIKTTIRRVEALTSARNLAFAFVEVLLTSVGQLGESQQIATINALLQVVVDRRMYAPRVQESSDAWRAVLRRSLGTLLGANVSINDLCGDMCSALGLLVDLDSDVVAPRLTSVLHVLLELRDHSPSQAEAVIGKLIEEASKTRTLPVLVQSLTDAIGEPPSASEKPLSAGYACLSVSSRKALVTACATDLSAEQLGALLVALLQRTSHHIQAFVSSSGSAGQSLSGAAAANTHHVLHPEAMEALVPLYCSLFSASHAALSNESKQNLADITFSLVQQAQAILADIPEHSIIQSGVASILRLYCVSAQALRLDVIRPMVMLDALERHTRPKAEAVSHLPVLILQLVQCAQSAILASDEAERLADCILQVTSHFDSLKTAAWDGTPLDLEASSLGVAVWQLALAHLPTSQGCTDSQLAVFADRLLQTASTIADSSSVLSFAGLSTSFLRSAASYENPRLQKAVITILEDTSKPILQYTDALGLLPPEWLSKAVRRTFCDRLALLSPPTVNVSQVMLNMTASDIGSPLSIDPKYMRKLSLAALDNSTVHALYTQLLRLTFRYWNATPSRYASLPDFVIPPVESSGTPRDMHDLRLFCIGLEALLHETKVTSIPAPQAEWLAQTARTAATELLHLIEKDAVPSSELEISLDVARSLIRFRKWCTNEDMQAVNALGESVIAKAPVVLQSAQDARTPLLLLDIASLNVGQDDRLSLEAFSALCIQVCLFKFADARDAVANILRQTASAQSAAQITPPLDSLTKALLDPVNTSLTQAILPCLAALLCTDASDSAILRLTSQYISTIIKLLPYLLVRQGTVDTSYAVLVFLRGICGKRIASLELHDVGSILKAVQLCISGNAEDGQVSTDGEGFTSAMAKVNDEASQLLTSLALYRRDLLLPLFAPFCKLLSLLVSNIDSGIAPRPASDRTNTHSNLEATPAHRWSRLVISLCARSNTTQRRGSKRAAVSSDRKRSTEQTSLVGALSKHAPFILFAYLRRSADTRTPLKPSIRAALLPGVYSLIGVMGQHEREALLRGFLTPNMPVERDQLRSLWTDYDKIRYKGH